MTAQLLTVVVAVFIPILNGLLTRYNAQRARVYLQLVLNAANGFVVEWLDALNTGAAFNTTEALIGTGLSLLTAIAVQAGVWAPLGVSEKVKSMMVGAKAGRD
jgi:hypothetical protein